MDSTWIRYIDKRAAAIGGVLRDGSGLVEQVVQLKRLEAEAEAFDDGFQTFIGLELGLGESRR